MNYRTCKKINFFGDSWYWNWYGPGVYDYELTSEIMKNNDSFRGEFGNTKINSLKFYLNELGFGVNVFNTAGYNFYQTTDSILKIEPTSDVLVNVVFFSNLIRLNNYFDFPVNDFKASMNKIEQDTINLLKKINYWAEKNKSFVFLIGGHSQLPIEFFKSAKCSPYVVLLSECILADLASKVIYKKTVLPFGMFKLACFTRHMDQSWDKKFVDVIYNDMDRFNRDKQLKLLTFPDYGHLNSLSSFALLDMIFDKVEKLQLNK